MLLNDYKNVTPREIRIIGIAAVLKTAGSNPMGVRVPHFPQNTYRVSK